MYVLMMYMYVFVSIFFNFQYVSVCAYPCLSMLQYALISLSVSCCICMYVTVSSCIGDSKYGVQGPAGTNASVRNRHARRQGRMHHARSHQIRIPITFCLLRATGSARTTSPMAAWLQNCAERVGARSIPRHNDTQPCERMDALQPCKALQSWHWDARLGME